MPLLHERPRLDPEGLGARAERAEEEEEEDPHEDAPGNTQPGLVSHRTRSSPWYRSQ